MKKAILSGLFALATLFSTSAQSGINYQAVVRDASGNILANENVNVEFRIIETSTNGTTVYAETQSVSTNAYGNIVAIIGQGTTTLGVFDDIDWGENDHFFNVQVDGTDMGTTQFMSAPYAKHAETSNTATGVNETNLKANVNGNGEVIIGSEASNAELLTIHANATTGELIDFRVDQLNAFNDLLNLEATVADDNSQLLEINANTDRIFAVNGDGSITRESSGNNIDMLPIAYGQINPNGSIITGTSNIGTITNPSTGQYEITINGETLNNTDYIVSVSSSNSLNNVGAAFTGGKVRVFVRDLTNFPTQYTNGSFSFIIYKP